MAYYGRPSHGLPSHGLPSYGHGGFTFSGPLAAALADAVKFYVGMAVVHAGAALAGVPPRRRPGVAAAAHALAACWVAPGAAPALAAAFLAYCAVLWARGLPAPGALPAEATRVFLAGLLWAAGAPAGVCADHAWGGLAALAEVAGPLPPHLRVLTAAWRTTHAALVLRGCLAQGESAAVAAGGGAALLEFFEGSSLVILAG